MTYIMQYGESGEIIRGEYFQPQDKKEEYFGKKKNIKAHFGNLKLKETRLPDICISNCQYNILKDIKLTGETRGEILCLTFMKKGHSSLSYNQKDICQLNEKTFNLICLSGKNNYSLDLKKGRKSEAMDIILSKAFFQKLVNRYPKIFEQLTQRYESKQTFIFHKNAISFDQEIQLILQQINEADLIGNTAPIYIEAKILELFSSLLKKENEKIRNNIPANIKDKIQEAKYILENNYLNPPRIHELALQAGICDTALKHYFKKMFNNTVYGYLFEFRMNKASHLLKTEENLNIAEIAEQTGYEHQTHFCTAFKRKFGVTPLEYKKRYE